MPFSFSQLSTYKTCPKQYEFASVKKIPRQISAGESFGSSMHNTLAKWGKLEMESGKRKEESDQLTLFTEEPAPLAQDLSFDTLLEFWHQSFIVEGYESKDDADAARKRGEEILRQYFDWWSAEKRDVVAIEKGFTIDIDVNSIKGRFDRIERRESGLCVLDYKTGGVRSQEDVDGDLQLSIYAVAVEQVFGEPCSELSLLFLRENGVVEITTHRSKQQKLDASQQIDILAAGIDEEEFDATPQENVCRKCPYRSICPQSAV